MSAPTWIPNAFGRRENYDSPTKPYVRRYRFTVIEPDTGGLWAAIYARLEPQDRDRMAWLSARAQVPDPDEHDLAPECVHCGGNMDRRNRTQRVCRECVGAGWRSTPCVRCGSYTHKRDRANKRQMPYLYGMCGACRSTLRGEEATSCSTC